VRPVALAAMLPYLEGHPADPGRLHAEGRVTRVAVEVGREQVAALFGARPREVVFTATGTEAVNTAIWGAVERADGRDRNIVTTVVEHSSVLDACARSDADVRVVGVDGEGRFDADEVAGAVDAHTAVVSVQLANHEVGTVQRGFARICAAARESDVLVHVDACAAAGHIPIDFAALGADLCSVTGHPWGAPKGAAALLVRRGLRVPPFVVGGAQERARRGGIEDVPAIVGFGAAAAELLDGDRLAREAAEARRLTDAIERSATAVPGVERFGPSEAETRLPNLVCLGLAGVEAEPVLLGLDQRGVAVHSGSSCSSELLEPSPVLRAMGVDADRSLRVSVGWPSTDADVGQFATAFPIVMEQLRALRNPTPTK
jgi:cysteine desulfurase